jgi:hypothetical protein
MNTFDPAHYGPAFQPLLSGNRRRALDASAPDVNTRPALQKLSASTAFEHESSPSGRRQPAVADMAVCCIAGVWLLHDFLDESHNISQRIDTPEGSYWHAIMHRREGDFSNSKYWYRHVGNHPVFNALAEQAHVAASLRSKIRRGEDAKSSFNDTRVHEWDPFDFVDQCQSAVRGKSDARELCLDLQQAEWELLFDYCYRKATAG